MNITSFGHRHFLRICYAYSETSARLSHCVGSFCADGRTELHFFSVKHYSEFHIDIVKNHLLPFMEIWRCEIFQQDNDPAHTGTSKTVKNWFANPGIQLLDWSENRPDLLYIQLIMWMILKRHV